MPPEIKLKNDDIGVTWASSATYGESNKSHCVVIREVHLAHLARGKHMHGINKHMHA